VANMPSTHRNWYAAILALLLSTVTLSSALAQVGQHPLVPCDTSSPQSTLRSFLQAVDEVYAIANTPDAEGYQSVVPLERAAHCLDTSGFPAEIRRRQAVEAALMLDDVLNRVDKPELSEVPGGDGELPKKWRFPNTPITIGLVEEGPRAGEYLFSAETTVNARRYYTLMLEHPYRDGSTPGLYTAYLTTPGRGIELGWSANFPEWSKNIALGQTYWQWIALALVLLFLALVFVPIVVLARRASSEAGPETTSRGRGRLLASLVLGLAGILTAEWFIDEFVNLTGDPLVVVFYLLAAMRYVLLGWIVLISGSLLVDTVIHVKGMRPGSASALLMRVGSWIVISFVLVGLGIAAAQSFGFPAYSIVTGLGVGGIAIGFGAQSLVRDILSGVFFLLDDAFREGDYIVVGEAQGTVEKISIRSMQLRHHRGAVHTIPYGEILQLTNYSRDWVILKLKFTVPFDTDPNQIKKIFKKIGAEMMEDPLYKDDFLEPFKSQGVFDFDDVGIVVRGKFMAKPGTQFTIRKEIYNRVKAEFDAAGIDFARREVRIALPGEARGEELSGEARVTAAAAAASALQASESLK
jgi:small-conductance mechanosensitive channel